MGQSPDQNHVVVLGHTGLLGRALAEAFQRRGGVRVRGYASSEVDLTQPRSVDRLMEVVSGDTALIMAAAIRRDVCDTVDAVEANTAMVANVVRLLQQRPVSRCVYVSSAAVYGDRPHAGPMTEETPVEPDSFYAIAKVTGERLLQCVAEAEEIKLIIVRPCRMYGPGDDRAAYGPARFLRTALEGDPVGLYGDGRELRDHLFVDDAAHAICELTLEGQQGIFNLATGRSLSYVAWLELIQGCLARPVARVQRARTRPQFDQWFDVSKLTRAVPTLRFMDPGQGLRRMYEARLQKPQGVVAG